MLDLTFVQLSLVTEMVLAHKVEMLEMVTAPIGSMLGKPTKKGRTSTRTAKGRGRDKKPVAQTQGKRKLTKAERRDVDRVSKLSRLGLKVKDG